MREYEAPSERSCTTPLFDGEQASRRPEVPSRSDGASHSRWTPNSRSVSEKDDRPGAHDWILYRADRCWHNADFGSLQP